MSYNKKWKPSKAQRKEFAINMQNTEFATNYNQRKKEKVAKKRDTSKFDYNTAGGMYIPTQSQYDFVMQNNKDLTREQSLAFAQIIYGFTCNEKVHHDSIHIVNELIRN